MTPITNLEDRALYAPLRLVKRDTACTGNCNQGRMCDCAPDVPCDQDKVPKPAMGTTGAALWIVYLVTFVAMVVVYGHFGGWFK